MSILSTLAALTPRAVKHPVKRILRMEEIPLTPGAFDLDTLPDLLGRADPVILDVGSNDGTHTLKFLELFPRARVYAFEPDPRAQKAWRENVRDERATLFECAVSDRGGETDFYVSDGQSPDPALQATRPDGWDFSGSIHRPKTHLEKFPWVEFKETRKVQTVRLDTWAASHNVGRIDFIWADVQGAEADLIRGGREALKRTHFLYTEYSDAELYEGQITLRELRRMLPRFDVLYRFSDDVLLKNRRPH